jgi:hypothetical protein
VQQVAVAGLPPSPLALGPKSQLGVEALAFAAGGEHQSKSASYSSVR